MLFNPYFGIDFLKINWITDVIITDFGIPWKMVLQLMPGIRGNSPVFFKCMSVYSAFRLGYGMDFRFDYGINELLGFELLPKRNFEGLCFETELGLNLTPTVFAGFAYNYHKYFFEGVDSKLAMHTFSFRVGFNFGKPQEAKKREIVNKQASQATQQRKQRDAAELRRDGVGLISAGAGCMGFGFILMGVGLGTDNSNCFTTGLVYIGAGGALTIASIPVLAVASARKKAASYTYQPTLDFNYTGNGLINFFDKFRWPFHRAKIG